jgi:hypothetical protein
MLHAEHSSVHALLQQTPLTQEPEKHWPADVQESPLDGSWRSALTKGTDVVRPPAMSTSPLLTRFAV